MTPRRAGVWTRIKHPSEVVKPGQKLQVAVLRLNLERGRVSLGLRQILPDPWENVKRLYSVGDVIKGTVTRIVPFGAFIQVEGGVEGIIPNSELAPRGVNNPEEVVSIDQEVQVKVIDIRPDERRMTLSIRQLQAQKEKDRGDSELRNYAQRRPDTRTTIGDLIGEQLGELALSAPSPKPARKARVRSAKKEAIQEAEALAEVDEELIVEEAAAKVEAKPKAKKKVSAKKPKKAAAAKKSAAKEETAEAADTKVKAKPKVKKKVSVKKPKKAAADAEKNKPEG